MKCQVCSGGLWYNRLQKNGVFYGPWRCTRGGDHTCTLAELAAHEASVRPKVAKAAPLGSLTGAEEGDKRKATAKARQARKKGSAASAPMDLVMDFARSVVGGDQLKPQKLMDLMKEEKGWHCDKRQAQRAVQNLKGDTVSCAANDVAWSALPGFAGAFAKLNAPSTLATISKNTKDGKLQYTYYPEAAGGDDKDKDGGAGAAKAVVAPASNMDVDKGEENDVDLTSQQDLNTLAFAVCPWASQLIISLALNLCGMDGAHLTGPYKGILLTLSFLTVFNSYELVCFAVVPTESADGYSLLLNLAFNTYPALVNKVKLTLVSDRAKGLNNAAVKGIFTKYLKVFFHCWCVLHLIANIVKHCREKKSPVDAVKLHALVMAAALSMTNDDFSDAVLEIHTFSSTAARRRQASTRPRSWRWYTPSVTWHMLPPVTPPRRGSRRAAGRTAMHTHSRSSHPPMLWYTQH
jgi:hypothetical protein